MDRCLLLRDRGLIPYESCWHDMRSFIDERSLDDNDELWLVQHPSVFTQGQAGKAEHLLNPGDVDVIKTDRGGQVTYHGPGQCIFYPLITLKRYGLGAKAFVALLETVCIDTLKDFNIEGERSEGAPGIYVGQKKIASLGLRIRKGMSYHGLSLNVDMDLAPFKSINPCGYPGLEMTQLKDIIPDITLDDVNRSFVRQFCKKFDVTIKKIEEFR